VPCATWITFEDLIVVSERKETPAMPTVRHSAFASILLIAGCTNFHVQSEHDPSFDYSKFKAYAWAPMTPTLGSTRPGDDAKLNDEIRRSVDSELASRGMRSVPEGEAQFLVRCETRVQFKQEVNDPYYSNESVEVHQDGRLTIDFLDPREGLILWHGTGYADLRTVSEGTTFSGLQPVDSMERLWPVDDLVKAILAEYPR
jgi:Domain of unknown function (DUF4136)